MSDEPDQCNDDEEGYKDKSSCWLASLICRLLYFARTFDVIERMRSLWCTWVARKWICHAQTPNVSKMWTDEP